MDNLFFEMTSSISFHLILLWVIATVPLFVAVERQIPLVFHIEDFRSLSKISQIC